VGERFGLKNGGGGTAFPHTLTTAQRISVSLTIRIDVIRCVLVMILVVCCGALDYCRCYLSRSHDVGWFCTGYLSLVR